MIIQNKKTNASSAQKKDNVNQSFHVKHGAAQQMQIIAGIHPVLEAINSDKQIDKIFIQNNLDGKLSKDIRVASQQKNIPLQYVPVDKLNALSNSNHQGVIAIVSPITYHSFPELLQRLLDEGKAPFLLLLDHVTDIRNLGAIARTAECAGVHAIVVPDHGSAQINPETIKSSSGALLHIPICREQNLKTTINLAKQSGLQICAATEKGATDYLDVDFCQPTLLIMGAEDKGISPELLKLADARAKLPILGQVQSLNVSAAAAIFIYEVLRQRRHLEN